MARLELLPGVFDDFARVLAHLEKHEAKETVGRIRSLVEALDVLRQSPRLGRPAKGGKRELVIGSGARGYLALYRYAPNIDTVFVLAIKGQREARFRRRR